MATLETNLFSSLRGRLGPVIAYQVGTQTRLRTVPAGYHDANTPEQQNNRRRLIACVRFYQRLKQTFLWNAWRVAASGIHAASGYSLYLGKNTKVFRGDGQIGDFSQLTLCTGKLPTMDNLMVQDNHDGTVTLTWENRSAKCSARNGDRLMVAYLHENRAFTIRFAEPLLVRRDDERATFPLERESGYTAHLYCFFVARDEKAYSTNIYLKVE